jgi:hypothetical protein
MKGGRPARSRCEYESERNGTDNIFMSLLRSSAGAMSKSPIRRNAVDYAHVLKDLADLHFPDERTIALVQDNLNTHATTPVYEAFPGAEATRLVECFEWRCTSKQGSWLDLAESELGVLSSQFLDSRIPDKQTLIDEIASWERHAIPTHKGQLAIHHAHRTHQTQARIPFNLIESGD